MVDNVNYKYYSNQIIINNFNIVIAWFIILMTIVLILSSCKNDKNWMKSAKNPTNVFAAFENEIDVKVEVFLNDIARLKLDKRINFMLDIGVDENYLYSSHVNEETGFIEIVRIDIRDFKDDTIF